MSSTTPAPSVASTLAQVTESPDEYMDELFGAIAEGRVIPIIGPELLAVEFEGQTVLLYDFLADQLRERLGLTNDVPAGTALGEVVAAFRRKKGRVNSAYTQIQSLLESHPFETPPALRKLAAIPQFKRFVSTTFDSLLTQALNEAHCAGKDCTQTVVFNTKVKPEDLKQDWSKTTGTAVFHLLGRVSSKPDYVVTEEDTLEFLHALQSLAPRSDLQFLDPLQENYLLILGCSFPDWLSRFFIRLAKRVPLSQQRNELEVLADSRTRSDSDLALFLDNFSSSTRIFPGNATAFVDRLAQEWDARHATARPATAPVVAARRVPDESTGPIFISYASEDRAAAERVYRALSEVSDVWFDKAPGALEYAHVYDIRITRAIQTCTLFIPIISANARERLEGYFRQEWKLAASRRERMADERAFIAPVVIDDTPPNADCIPAVFWDSHVAFMPGGEVDESFVQEIAKAVRDLRTPGRRI